LTVKQGSETTALVSIERLGVQTGLSFVKAKSKGRCFGALEDEERE